MKLGIGGLLMIEILDKLYKEEAKIKQKINNFPTESFLSPEKVYLQKFLHGFQRALDLVERGIER